MLHPCYRADSKDWCYLLESREYLGGNTETLPISDIALLVAATMDHVDDDPFLGLDRILKSTILQYNNSHEKYL